MKKKKLTIWMIIGVVVLLGVMSSVTGEEKIRLQPKPEKEKLQEIEKYIESLSPSMQDSNLVKQDIEFNKSQTRNYIQQIRDNFPELSYSLETHSAHRLMLNLERVYLDDLISEGVLDDSEANKLTNEIENKFFNK